MLDGRGLSAPQQQSLQQLVRSLKDELKAEYSRTQTSRSEQTMPATESAFYKPAIVDVWANNPQLAHSASPAGRLTPKGSFSRLPAPQSGDGTRSAAVAPLG